MSNIKVGVRIRPLIEREIADAETVFWKCHGNTILRSDTDAAKIHYYDNVFNQESTNSEIFESMVEPLIKKAVEGFNATVLTYGQTSSGKTHTMMGHNLDQGIIPLSMEYIFDAIEHLPDERCFLLGVSFLEVYNEKVRDLLNPEKFDLQLQQDMSGSGVRVDCKVEMVSSAIQMLSLMELGNKNKAIGETKMNARSSRSHTIFRIVIESQDKSQGNVSRCSQINLVDLAGSERVSQTGAVGQRYKEGCAINTSLLQLGNVVQKLSENKGEFIDYRTSKLTRLLQASLSGNANIAMICNITPVNVEQTNNTLLFASRASTIQVSPHLNEVMDDATLIRRHTKKIKELEQKLKQAEHLEVKNQTLEKEIEKLREMLVVSKLPTVNIKEEKERALRRQTWGGGLMRRQPLMLAANFNRPQITGSNVDAMHLPSIAEQSSRHSMNNSWESNLSNEEQPSTMSNSSDDTSVRSSLALTPCRSLPGLETSPHTIRRKVLELQKIAPKSGTPSTPPSILRRKIAELESKLASVSTNSTTLPETLQERISVLGEVRTPVSTIKHQLQNLQPVTETPPNILRQQIAIKNLTLSSLEREYSELREYTTLERQVLCDEENKKLIEEIESLKHAIEDYEHLCVETKKEALDLADENQSLRDEIQSLEKELEVNRTWSSNVNEQQLMWKKDLVEAKEKLVTLTNQSQDWQDERNLLKSRYEEKIKELQQSLGEAWNEQERLKSELQHNLNKESNLDDDNVRVKEVLINCDDCDSLREKLFFKNQEIENFKMEMLVKQETLSYANVEIEKLKAELTQSNRNHSKLELHLEHKEESYAKELHALRKQLDEMKTVNVTQHFADIKIEETVTTSKSETENEKLERQIAELLEDKSELSSQLMSLRDQLLASENTRQDLEHRFSLITQERQEVEKKLQTFFDGKSHLVEVDGNTMHDQTSLEKEQIVNKLSAMQAECQEAEEKLESYKSQLQDLHQQVESINAEKMDVLAELEELKERKQNEVFEFQHDSLTFYGPEIEISLQQKVIDLERRLANYEQPQSNDVDVSVCQQDLAKSVVGDAIFSQQLAESENVDEAGDTTFSQQLEKEIEMLKENNCNLNMRLQNTLDITKMLGLLPQLECNMSTPAPEIEKYIASHIQQLQDTKESLEAQLSTITEELETLDCNLSEKTMKLNEANEVIEEVTGNKTKLENEIKKLHEQLQNCDENKRSASLDEVSSYIKRLTTEIRALNPNFSLEELKQQDLLQLHESFLTCVMEKQSEIFSHLQSQLQDLKQKNSVLKSDLASKHEQSETLLVSNEDLKKRLAVLENECSDNVTSLSTRTEIELNITIQQLENELTSREKEHSDKVSELECLFDEAKQSIQKLEETLEESRKSEFVINEQLLEVLERETKLSEQNLQLEHNLRVMREMAETLEQEVMEMKQQKTNEPGDDLQEQLTNLKHGIMIGEEKLTQENQWHVEEIKQLKSKLLSMESGEEKLTQENQRHLEEIQHLKSKLISMESGEEKLTQENQRHLEEIQHLKSELTAIESNERESHVHIENISKELAETREKLGGEFQDKTIDFQRNKQEINQHIQDLEAAVNNSAHRIQYLEQELKRSEEDKTLSVEMQTQAERTITSLETTLREYLQKISDVEQELVEERESHDKLKQSLSDTELIKTQLCELQMKYKEYQQKISDIEQELVEERESHDKLKQSLSDTELIKTQLCELQMKYKEYQQKISDVEQELVEERESHDKLKQSLSDTELIKTQLCELQMKYKEEKLKHDNYMESVQKEQIRTKNIITEQQEKETILEMKLEQLELQYIEIVTEFKSLQSKHAMCDDMVEQMRVRLHEKTEGHDLLTTQFTKLSEDLNSKCEELYQMQGLAVKFDALNAEHSNCKLIREELETSKCNERKYNSKLEEMTLNLRNISDEYDDILHQNQELRKQKEDFEDMCTKLKKSICEIETYNEEMRKKIKNQDEMLVQYQQQITMYVDKKEDLQLQLTREKELHVVEVNQTRDTLRQTELRLQQIRKDHEEQVNQVSTLAQHLTASNTILNETTSERDTLRIKVKELMELNQELKEKNKEAEEEFQDMLQSYRDNERKANKFESEAYKLELQIMSLNKKLEAQEEEISNFKKIGDVLLLQKTLTECQEELQAKVTSLAQSQEQAKMFEESSSKYLEEVKQLRMNYADARGEIAILKRQIEAEALPYKNDAESFKWQFDQSKRKLQSLQSEIRNLRANQHDSTFQECLRCQRTQRACKETQTSRDERHVEVQAPPDNEFLYDRKDGYLPSSAVTEAGRMYGMKQQLDDAHKTIKKLQDDRVMFKDAIRIRNRTITALQQQLDNKENKDSEPSKANKA